MRKRLIQAFVIVSLVLGLVVAPGMVSKAAGPEYDGPVAPCALDGGGSNA